MPLDLKDVEPAEGRLEFLAYLVNEEQRNQSLQVTLSNCSNLLTQALSCHAFTKELNVFCSDIQKQFYLFHISELNELKYVENRTTGL